MSRGVVVVRADSLVEDAVRLMLDHRISGLPVLDIQGCLVGMLTESDLLRRTETDTECRPSWLQGFFQPGQIATRFVQANGRRVCEVMSADLATVVEATPIRDLVTLLQLRHINRVPVMRGRAVVGIVARADIVRGLGSILDGRRSRPLAATGDVAIRRRLQTALDAAAWTPKGITFTVTDGRVHFYGPIRDGRERLALQVTAENVPGVMLVMDHLLDTNQDAYAHLRPNGVEQAQS